MCICNNFINKNYIHCLKLNQIKYMIKYLNQKPKLYIITSLFISSALVIGAITFNIAYGCDQYGNCGPEPDPCQCSTTCASNLCGDTNCCSCGSCNGCEPPPIPGPAPFECNDMDVSYVERLPYYKIDTGPVVEGLNPSITSNGKYTVKGMTRHGARSCSEILSAIQNFADGPLGRGGSCAYPSSVREESLKRGNWAFNNMTTTVDCGNSKNPNQACLNWRPGPVGVIGLTVIGATPTRPFTEYRTILQNAAPTQTREGGLYGNIVTDNVKRAPYPVTKFYNLNNYETLKLAFNYEMVYATMTDTRPCFSAGPSGWRECHKINSFTFIPRVQPQNIERLPGEDGGGGGGTEPRPWDHSYQIKHRDRDQSIYRNSPIRKSWNLENYTYGTCKITTKDSAGGVVSALSRSGINADRTKVTQIVDFLPIDGKTGEYLENVDKNANYTIEYDPSRIKPGEYTSLLSCDLTLECSTDDCKVTHPYARTRTETVSRNFTIAQDPSPTLKAVAKPRILSKRNVRTIIEATTTGGASAYKHTYKIIKIPEGYTLISNPEIVTTDIKNGSSKVSWEVILDIDPESKVKTKVGTSQFVIQMIDEPYDNLYTAKAQVTYLGTRDISEVAP